MTHSKSAQKSCDVRLSCTIARPERSEALSYCAESNRRSCWLQHGQGRNLEFEIGFQTEPQDQLHCTEGRQAAGKEYGKPDVDQSLH